MRLSRRGFLLSSLTAMAAMPGYGRFLEAGWLEATRKRVFLPRGRVRQTIRLLHLSDLHAGGDAPFALIEQAIAVGLAQEPDLACLTGDYITQGRIPDSAQYLRVLRRLAVSVPTYASLGNHDGGAWTARKGRLRDVSPMKGLLESAGITCLSNQATVATAREQKLNVVGIGDLWAHKAEPSKAFGAVSSGDFPTIVLSHNPDTAEMLRPFPWQLLLCGHTHGGQIVIPLLGGAPWAPVTDRRFLRGLHRWDGRYIHVTRGIGSIWGIRFNCRPEVSLLEIRSA